LEKLLTLQNPRSTPAEHDEMLFIIIHHTYGP
jgi:tryptophan 2,3-dioxygenase